MPSDLKILCDIITSWKSNYLYKKAAETKVQRYIIIPWINHFLQEPLFNYIIKMTITHIIGLYGREIT